jgi:5-methylcytosine-specific restriction endonuclease McrA
MEIFLQRGKSKKIFSCDYSQNKIYSYQDVWQHNILCRQVTKTIREVMDLQQRVLRTDVSGMPLEWVGYEDAVRLITLDQVSYSLGTTLYTIHGGINAYSGRQSVVSVNAIIATEGHNPHKHLFARNYVPPLSNKSLFRRDQSLCLYCGQQFPNFMLSRDHVKPLSQGGQDRWVNVVTACKRCNNHKANRTPEQAGMELLAIPFCPTHAEYVYLQGRQILSDQMEFLLAHFPRNSVLRKRVEGGEPLLT